MASGSRGRPPAWEWEAGRPGLALPAGLRFRPCRLEPGGWGRELGLSRALGLSPQALRKWVSITPRGP